MKAAAESAHGPKCVYIDRFLDTTRLLLHFAHRDFDVEFGFPPSKARPWTWFGRPVEP